MLHLIAEATTQPGAWRTWTAQDWVLLIGAIAAAVATVLAAWAKIQASAAQTTATNASTTAGVAKGMADVLDSRANALASHVQSVDRQQTETVANVLRQVSDNAQRTSPPTPTPEAIEAATAAADSPEKL